MFHIDRLLRGVHTLSTRQFSWFEYRLTTYDSWTVNSYLNLQIRNIDTVQNNMLKRKLDELSFLLKGNIWSCIISNQLRCYEASENSLGMLLLHDSHYLLARRLTALQANEDIDGCLSQFTLFRLSLFNHLKVMFHVTSTIHFLSASTTYM